MIDVAVRLAGLYWRVFAPVTLGVRVLVTNGRGQVLLCRHTYGDRTLQLPGGRVRRRETVAQAALRELREESGIDLGTTHRLALLGVYTSFCEGKSDHVVVFTAHVDATTAASTSAEIAEIGFFDLDPPPDDVSPGTRRRLAESTDETGAASNWQW